MMHAYDQTLLYKARTSMAFMFDYAVYVQEVTLEDFYQMFLESPISAKFEMGDSSTIAGKSGIELAYQILLDNDSNVEFKSPVYDVNRSPEYWVGFVLSYYQWEKNIRFRQITAAVPIDNILHMYKKYHEIDIRHFVNEMDLQMEEAFSESALKRFREYARLSQSELAKRANVPVRTIQQYEQKQKNINHAKAETVIHLAKALYCQPIDLLNIQ